MADNGKGVCESITTKNTYKKKISITKYRPSNKNSLRRIRRKRSKIRYYKSLKRLRYNRKTEDLCSAVQVFDISDMEWAPNYSSSVLPSEVTEWQKQDQIAYWKSRAISLELENRMLHQHLRNVYAKTIEDRLQCEETYPQYDNTESRQKQIGEKEERVQKVISRKKDTKEESKLKKPVSPKEPEGKNRFEEMKKIYGHTAPKIMGMETALQLNYERIVDQSKPPHWPTVPLRLSFG